MIKPGNLLKNSQKPSYEEKVSREDSKDANDVSCLIAMF